MGLDLYIRKRRRKSEDTLELAYFRKVNFLIPWFEKWYNTEIENCKDLPIDDWCCTSLCEACDEVLNHHEKAKELLPTQSGLFFGSTEYDEDYFNDVDLVRDVIMDNVIPEFEDLEDDEEIVFTIWY